MMLTFDHPLVGRRARFEGRFRGVEGIVLAFGADYDVMEVLLERTSHPCLPPEMDGARPIVLLRLDTHRGDVIYVMPPEATP